MSKFPVLAVLALLCSASVATAAAEKSRPLDDDEKQVISNAIRSEVGSRSSLDFQWPPLPIGEEFSRGRFGYCFSMNVKNSDGAATGFIPIHGLATRVDGKVTAFERTTSLGKIDAGLAYRTKAVCDASVKKK